MFEIVGTLKAAPVNSVPVSISAEILENKEIANEYYFLLNSGILKKEINEIEYLYYSSITWDAIEKSEQKTIEELKATYKCWYVYFYFLFGFFVFF